MVNVPTLLVLGAGASSPFGFPSGRRLRGDIALTLLQAPYLPIFEQFGFGARDVKHFVKQFLYSGQYSIDRFLFLRQEFSEIGKLAIALVLLASEKDEVLFDPNIELQDDPNPRHWYQYLWNQLSGSFDDFKRHQLRIVTFNYDRSLERYLATTLAISNGKQWTDGIAALEHLRIRHVYGQLGKLGEMNPEKGERSYDSALNQYSARIAWGGIRTIHERDHDEALLNSIRDDMLWAQRVCFLGFSYDSLNLERLSVSVLLARANARDAELSVYGTTMGLEASEREKAIRTINARQPDYFLPVDNEVLLRRFGILDER